MEDLMRFVSKQLLVGAVAAGVTLPDNRDWFEHPRAARKLVEISQYSFPNPFGTQMMQLDHNQQTAHYILDSLENAALDWVRIGVDWSACEPNQGMNDDA